MLGEIGSQTLKAVEIWLSALTRINFNVALWDWQTGGWLPFFLKGKQNMGSFYIGYHTAQPPPLIVEHLI